MDTDTSELDWWKTNRAKSRPRAAAWRSQSDAEGFVAGMTGSVTINASELMRMIAFGP